MTYRWITPAPCAAALVLLAVASALMLLAQRRDWRPPLAMAIYTALVLRLVMLALAYRIRPWDGSRRAGQRGTWARAHVMAPAAGSGRGCRTRTRTG